MSKELDQIWQVERLGMLIDNRRREYNVSMVVLARNMGMSKRSYQYKNKSDDWTLREIKLAYEYFDKLNPDRSKGNNNLVDNLGLDNVDLSVFE
nr:hypothetical protein [uncultured Draconibacterium sp.]